MRTPHNLNKGSYERRQSASAMAFCALNLLRNCVCSWNRTKMVPLGKARFNRPRTPAQATGAKLGDDLRKETMCRSQTGLRHSGNWHEQCQRCCRKGHCNATIETRSKTHHYKKQRKLFGAAAQHQRQQFSGRDMFCFLTTKNWMNDKSLQHIIYPIPQYSKL